MKSPTNYRAVRTFKLESRGANLVARVTGQFATTRNEQQIREEFKEAGWRADDTEALDAATLAANLCHAKDSGLESNPETAEKVAAWLLKNYDITLR